MRFDLDVYPRDRTRSLPGFITIVGWDFWRKRLEELRQACQRSPVIGSYLEEKHAIEFEVARLHKRKEAIGRLPGRLETSAFYRLASLSTAVVAIHGQLNQAGKGRLRGMVLDALKSDFASLEHEMSVAAHLVKRGFDVDLPDIEGTGRFDFLARKEARKIEIECKSVSYDAGRKIHRSDFYTLADSLYPMFTNYTDKNSESRMLILSVQDRLMGSSQVVHRISAYVRGALQQGRVSITNADLTLDCVGYDPRRLPPDDETLRTYIEEQIGSDQFHAFVYGNSTCVVVFVARSQKPDRVLSSMYHQMRTVSDQCTGRRPAIVWVRLEGIYPDQWQTLSTDSALQRMTHRYLLSPSRSHVHSVAYSSTGWLERRSSAVTKRGPVFVLRIPIIR